MSFTYLQVGKILNWHHQVMHSYGLEWQIGGSTILCGLGNATLHGHTQITTRSIGSAAAWLWNRLFWNLIKMPPLTLTVI